MITNINKKEAIVMPGWDGRGPWFGSGPGTGWGMGPCGAGYRRGRGFRRGAGFGGFGRGWSGRYWGYAPYGAPWAQPYPAMDPADEKQALQEELSALEAEMRAVKDRLDSMEKEA